MVYRLRYQLEHRSGSSPLARYDQGNKASQTRDCLTLGNPGLVPREMMGIGTESRLLLVVLGC